MIDTRPNTPHAGTVRWHRIASLSCALAALDMAGGAWVSFAGARARHDSGLPLLAMLMLLATVALSGAAVFSFRQRGVAGALVCAAYLMTAVPFYVTTSAIAGPTLFMVVAVFAMAMPSLRGTPQAAAIA